jgi:hypothetical protein
MHKKIVALCFAVAAALVAQPAEAAPTGVSAAARLPIPPQSGGVRAALSGGYAFTSSPFVVYDVRNPLAPTVVTSIHPVGGNDVAVYGNYLYQVGIDVNVVDVSDPRAPVVINTGTIPAGSATKIAISGSFLFVASANVMGYTANELRIYSLVNPAAPALVATLPLPYAPSDVAVSGSTAYLADGTGGLRIVDISVPSAPHEIAALAVGNARGVAVSGTYAYVTTHDDYCDEEYCGPVPGQLVVVDVTGAACPRIVGTVATPKAAEDIVVAGRYAYMVERSVDMNGTYQQYLAADVSVPTSPQLVQFSNEIYFAQGLTVSGGYVFVPTRNNLFVYRTVEAPPPAFVCPGP